MVKKSRDEKKKKREEKWASINLAHRKKKEANQAEKGEKLYRDHAHARTSTRVHALTRDRGCTCDGQPTRIILITCSRVFPGTSVLACQCLISMTPSSQPHSTVGQNKVILRHPIIHFSTNSGVSARAKWAGRKKRMSERCERTSKRTSEWLRT